MTRPLFEEVELIFAEDPQPKPSDGHRWTHRKYPGFLKLVRFLAGKQWPYGLVAIPLSVDIDLYLEGRRRRIDTMNLEGGICDALTGAVWTDDCWIDEIHTRRFFESKNSGFIVRVRPLTPAPKKSTVAANG